MDLNLQSKVAIVTGGNRGIGAAVALQLAREGMDIALVARDEELLIKTAEAISKETGRRIHCQPADLRRSQDAVDVVARVKEVFGRLDLLVNNAGAAKRGDFFEMTDADWNDGFDLKLHGYVRMTRAAWPLLEAQKGVVINIVGVGAWSGIAEFTIGGAINAALQNFTKAMADVGKTRGVRVCAVNPGRIETERLSKNMQRIADLEGIDKKEAAARLLTECHIARFGHPEEIGAAVAFLASDQASFAQGTLLDIDGGETRSI
jgi:NAD(P)-dependent dehydrogenase (short-subunit alcohol dehydrogenase family)